MPRTKTEFSPLAVAGLFVAVVCLWALTPVVIAFFYPNLAERGQVGDLFGSVNSLFSGLAFTGVIITLFLQREELQLQREELAANRTELARAATAQEESREALRGTIHAQAFKAAMDILQVESVRQNRGVVLSQLKDKQLAQWSDDEKGAAESVCHTYDCVGIMVRSGMLPVELVADHWGDSLRRTWAIVAPLVSMYRLERDSCEIWDDYEYLATEAVRFRRRNP